ncbi:hypothetical protein [Halorarius litoreus]|uniref:hypothetical protein n=1 Tax=Halorarius litoreus TaxID=2962676 RepID=UPI0020CF77EF|nr:hypothetical protein [Halorarius litoreus]
MRPVTRNVVVGILVVLVLLLALGALPSYLKSGDPYYLEATVVTETPADVQPANITNLSQRRYPYTFGALGALDALGNESENASASATGRSEPYWRGPFGFKGAFTHSPFDEVDAYTVQYPDAVRTEQVYVSYEGTRYRLEVIQP